MRRGRSLRGLSILGTGKHHHIGRRSLGFQRALSRLTAVGRFFEKANRGTGHTGKISLSVRREGTEQILRGLLGQIRLFQDSLGGVYVGEVERGSGVTGVKDGREAYTGTERSDHDGMHVVVNNVAGTLIVDGVDDIVKAIILVPVQVGRPTTMTREVDEERIVWLSISDEPMHGTQDVGLGRYTHGILLIVRQNDHILAAIPVSLMQEGGHVGYIVDTTVQFVGLTKIVDPDEQRLSAPSTCRVLKLIA